MTFFLLCPLLLGLVIPGQDSLAPQAARGPIRCEYPDHSKPAKAPDPAALAEACRALIESEPANADAYLVLMLAVMDDSTAQLDVLESALEAVPDNPFVQFNAGMTLRRFGRFEEALVALERAAQLEPSEADPLVQAGIAAIDMGQLERAVSYLQQASIREPDEPKAWGYLARAKATLGRHADAVRHWDRAQEESGWKYLYRHDDQEAYDSSLAIAPDAHVRPSQVMPTLRMLGMLAIPAALALGLATAMLRLGRKRWAAPLMRLFVAIALVHFIASKTMLLVTIGAAYSAHQGWPGLWIEKPLVMFVPVLMQPLIAARNLLPWQWGINYGWPWTLLNSLVWAGIITWLVHLWHRRQLDRMPGGPEPGGAQDAKAPIRH